MVVHSKIAIVPISLSQNWLYFFRASQELETLVSRSLSHLVLDSWPLTHEDIGKEKLIV